MTNPFTLSFGKKPLQYVLRISQPQRIVEQFNASEPLNLTAVRKQYMDIFQLNTEAADEMAGLTKGYPFAFQVLGYLYWENKNKKTLEDILPEYDQYLEEYVYSEIWSEASLKDQEILGVMSQTGETKVKKYGNVWACCPLHCRDLPNLFKKGCADPRYSDSAHPHSQL